MTLVAYYPLHENSGSTAYDVRGSNDGTVNGATMGVEGINGNTAYSFDGTDDYIETPTLGIFDGSQSYSISAWVNLDNVTSEQGIYIPRGERNVLFTANDADDGDQPMFGWYDGNRHYAYGTQLTESEWTHLVGIYDPSTGPRLYQNSKLDGENSDTGTPRSQSGTNRIGSHSDTGWYNNGRIAEVRIYDHALTPGEVQYLYEVSQRGDYTSSKKTL